jgi:hypothetical protein
MRAGWREDTLAHPHAKADERTTAATAVPLADEVMPI